MYKISISELIKNKSVAGKYIFSGLLKAAAYTVSGFIILMWINPEELGTWQSFTVFIGYIQILTLGTTSGLNRELPFYLGKGNKEIALKKLEACGYYTTLLSTSLMIVVIILGLLLWQLNVFIIDHAIMFVFAFSTAALSIQTNFLGATFRSSNSFNKLTIIQMLNVGLYFLLIPLIYFFNIWGYIVYQTLLALFLFIGYYLYRPHKIKYKYNYKETIELIKVGFPMYFWNYLSEISRSIPRTILVIFGNPLMVGLYSPAGSINSAMLELPAYTNRYLLPQMAYRYGKTNDRKIILNYATKAAFYLFVIMLVAAVILVFIIPPVFNAFFQKYTQGIVAAQITVFSGVFYSVNSIFHNTLVSIKAFAPFKFIITLRFIYILLFTAISWFIIHNILVAVAIGDVIAEFFNMFNYYYFLKISCRKNP